MEPGRRSSAVPPRARALRIGTVVVLGLLALFIVARGVAYIWTDALWFSAEGRADVFKVRFGAQTFLAIAFTIAFLAMALGNVAAAEWSSLRNAPSTSLLVARYHDVVGRRHRLVMFGVAVLLAVFAGVPAAAEWRSWLLFTNGQSLGIADPLLHRDVGEYLFRLPFLSFFLSWMFASLITVTLLTVAVYFLNGMVAARRSSGTAVSRGCKMHLSFLVAALAVVRAIQYVRVDQPALTLARGRHFDGAAYADVAVRLPGFRLLALIGVLTAVLVVFNVFRRGITMPLMLVGLWALTAVLVTGVAPVAVQNFWVNGSPVAHDKAYAANAMAASAAAWGLDGRVSREPIDLDDALTSAAVTHTAADSARLPIVDADITASAWYQKFKRESPQNGLVYSATLDRYVARGVVRPVLVGVREAAAPSGSWRQRHVTEIHGSGVYAAYADQVDANGELVPVTAEAVNDGLLVTRPETYFGLSYADNYAVVTPSAASRSPVPDGGVALSGAWRRLAMSLRVGDLELMWSSNAGATSRLLMRRQIFERLVAVAPFLQFSQDPIPVVIDGRVNWVVDGFTTSATYPYSQHMETDSLVSSDGRQLHDINYMRGSVKATVDAYDGRVRLYAIDDRYGPTDPVLAAWRRAFPGLVESADELPPEVSAHLRYPSALMELQTRLLERQHVTDAADLFDSSTRWASALRPSTRIGASSSASETEDVPESKFLRKPDTASGSFVRTMELTTPPTGAVDDRLTAMLVADQDSANYGDLTLYTLREGAGSDDANTSAPGPLKAQIALDKAVQADLVSGAEIPESSLRYGRSMLFPVENSLVWFRPVYHITDGGHRFDLIKVAAAFGSNAVVADSVPEALTALVRGGAGKNRASVLSSLEEATRLLIEGQAALSQPNGLAVYQHNNERALQLIRDALAQLRGGSDASTSTTAEPVTTATTTASTAVVTSAPNPAATSVPAASTTSAAPPTVGGR